MGDPVVVGKRSTCKNVDRFSSETVALVMEKSCSMSYQSQRKL
jgi:hypothetical protein